MNWLELKYVNLLSGRLTNFVRKNDRLFNFSCPLCGDSATKKKKARGFIYDQKGTTRFHCHNCGADKPFWVFMKELDEDLFNDYSRERITSGFWTPSNSRARAETFPEKFKGPTKFELEKDPLGMLKSIDRTSEKHVARKLLLKRMIPDIYWKKIYHCPSFCRWVNHFKPETFSEAAEKNDEARLVIPFFDEAGKMIALQGRSYRANSGAKYITIKIDEDAPKIFGLDTVDRSRTVYALEGPIDSMFIRNSVAFAGGDTATLSGFNPDTTVVVYDNEPRSPHIKKKMMKAIAQGFSVACWPPGSDRQMGKSLKDVNDYVMAGFPIDLMNAVVKGCARRGLEATIKLNAWSLA